MYTRQLADARTYYRNIAEWLGLEDGQPVSEAIRLRLNEDSAYALLRKAQKEAALHTESYTIVAPRDGAVSQIYYKEGEVVTSDLPLLRLINDRPSRILVYLEDPQVDSLQVGQRLRVHSPSRRTRNDIFATVESVGKELKTSATTLTITGREVPLRAQRAKLRIDDHHDFIGGETVYLRHPTAGIVGILGSVFGPSEDQRQEAGYVAL